MANTSKRTPKEYQREALNAIKESRSTGRGLIVMASGLGKTMTSIFDIESFLKENQGAKVMFLNDNISILEQAKKEFKRFFGDEYSYGLVSSTSMPKKDVDFLFASFDSMTNRLAGYDATQFDYIVVDEAHHAQAPTYKKVIKHFQPKYLLGMTATPVRLDQKKIEELFGDPIYNLGFGRALAKGLLTPVKYSIMDDELNVDEIEKFMTSSEKISLSQLNQRFFIPKRDQEIVRIVRNRIQELGGNRTVIFCRNIQHAEKIAGLMPEAEVVHSGMNIDDANARIEQFKHGRIAILIAVDKLNEGVDIPEIDVVVFLRTTTSPTILLQQMGRGLRLVPGKPYVHILDFVANYERLIDIGNLQKEIGAHTIKGSRKANQTNELDDAFDVSMPSKKFKEHSIELSSLLDKINSISPMVKRTKEERFEDYKKFYEEHGRFPTVKEMNAEHGLLDGSSYITLFGSMENLKRLVTDDIPYVRKNNFSTEELIELFKKKVDSLGYIPTASEIDNDNTMPCWLTYAKRFGTMEKLILLANVTSYKKSPNSAKRYTDDDIIMAIQKKTQELGRPPYSHEMSNPSIWVIQQHFGNLANAIAAAGNNAKHRTYTREDLIAIIRAKENELGRPPKQSDILLPTHNTFLRHFGSWPNALSAAGCKVTEKVEYTKEMIIKRVRELANQLGHPPTETEMSNPSYRVCRRIFGSWNETIIAAGYEPRKTK